MNARPPPAIRRLGRIRHRHALGGDGAMNSNAVGETWLRLQTKGDDVVRLGIADMRLDGRSDYAYNGWVLYADTVFPQRLPLSGRPIVIRGTGFLCAGASVPAAGPLRSEPTAC